MMPGWLFATLVVGALLAESLLWHAWLGAWGAIPSVLLGLLEGWLLCWWLLRKARR
jgi:hypothetical protein